MVEAQMPQPRAARVDWPKPRSGQAMTYAPSSGLIFLFGGYDMHYMNDLWTLSLGRTDFPSLADIAGKAVKRQHGAKTDELPIPEDLKQRLRDVDVGKQMEWREECVGEATQDPQHAPVPARTTAGICVVDRALYMFGGSQGSPENSDIFEYDLGDEAGARRWSKLEVSGAKPNPSNYSKLVVWGTRIVAINDENAKQGVESFHVFDTTTAEWRCYKSSFVRQQAFEYASVGIAHGHLCFANPEGTQLYHMALDDLAAAESRPAESESRLEWKVLDLERGEPATNPMTTCWAGPHLFGLSEEPLHSARVMAGQNRWERGTTARMSVLSVDLAKGSPVTLVGEVLEVAQSGATMCGSPSRLVVFGGHNANAGYSQATTVLDVTDLVVAKVTNL